MDFLSKSLQRRFVFAIKQSFEFLRFKGLEIWAWTSLVTASICSDELEHDNGSFARRLLLALIGSSDLWRFKDRETWTDANSFRSDSFTYNRARLLFNSADELILLLILNATFGNLIVLNDFLKLKNMTTVKHVYNEPSRDRTIKYVETVVR